MSHQLVDPFQENITESSESDDEQPFVLTNNVGTLHTSFVTERDTFIDRNNQRDFVEVRDNLFTKEITKFPLLVDSKYEILWIIGYKKKYAKSNYTNSLINLKWEVNNRY